MAPSLSSLAALAHDVTRALERALAATRSQWGDATRQSFDQQQAEVLVASGRKVAAELSSLAVQLGAVLASQ